MHEWWPEPWRDHPSTLVQPLTYGKMTSIESFVWCMRKALASVYELVCFLQQGSEWKEKKAHFFNDRLLLKNTPTSPAATKTSKRAVAPMQTNTTIGRMPELE